MAGTLEISDESCWMPAGWVYDTVLERLASVLKAKDSALADVLLESRTGENGGYCDLRMCDATRLSKLVQAAEDAYAEIESEGPNSFHDPTFYRGFVDQFRKLRTMLHSEEQKRLRAD